MAENIANLSKYVVETHKPFVKEIKHWMEEMDAASDSISKLSKARNDLFMLGVDNLDAKQQGQYETFQDLIDKATERLMHAGEMVGKMSKEKEKDDDENDSDDENDKAKKRPAR